MVTALQKGMIAFAGVAVIGGGLAGAGLASFAQNGAFEFYKQTPPPVQHDLADAPPTGGYYAASSAAPMPAYPENPYPRPISIARPAEPADYRPAAQIDSEPAAVEEQAALPEPGPVIVSRGGSWSAPEESPAAPDDEAPADDDTAS